MIIYYLTILALSLLFISTVVMFNKGKDTSATFKDDCETDEDCRDETRGGKPGARCEYNKAYEKRKCILDGQAICKVRGTNGKDWNEELEGVHEGENRLTICQSDSDCDGCINQPQWGCYKMTGAASVDTLTKIQSCKDCGDLASCPEGAYSDEDGKCNVLMPRVDEDGNDVNLQGEEVTHGYCMPIVTDQVGLDGTSKCNSQTSDIFLTQSGEYSSQWSCLCRNPAMFAHQDTSTSNCVHEKICGADAGLGALYMDTDKPCSGPDSCGEDSVCCVKDSTAEGDVCLKPGDTAKPGEEYTCHVRWDLDNEKNWSELGKCNCEDGYTYVTEGKSLDTSSKLCIPDQCYNPEDGKGRTRLRKDGEDVACDCPEDSLKPISCTDLPEDTTFEGNARLTRLKEQCSAFPMCLSDPCNPGNREDGGKYTGKGVFYGPAACTCPPGKASIATSSNWSGAYCENPCINNGPCGELAEDGGLGSARGYCRVASDEDGTVVECVGPEVGLADCESREKDACDGLCVWNSDKNMCLSSVPVGAGGCPCPWMNTCNEHLEQSECQGDPVCEWHPDGNPPSNNPYGPGVKCRVKRDLLTKPATYNEDDVWYANQCREQDPLTAVDSEQLCFIGTSCCNADRTGYLSCVEDKKGTCWKEWVTPPNGFAYQKEVCYPSEMGRCK